MSQGTVSELVIYPVKSLQGIFLQKSTLTEQGLKWDRNWMIVNEDGLFVTQRHFTKMAQIKTAINDTHLILSHPEHEDCLIDLVTDKSKQDKRQVKVWSSECVAIDEGEQVTNWLTKVLGKWRGQSLSLVKMSDEHQRFVSDKHTKGESNTTLFSDGYPFLVTTTASLQYLNDKLVEQEELPVPMSRFRPNIVIDNKTDVNSLDHPTFVEHESDNLAVQTEQGSIDFHLCKPCERCKVPSIDQQTAQIISSKQPLKTLFEMDNVKQKGAFFGENAVLTKATKQQGDLVISVGDAVYFS